MSGEFYEYASNGSMFSAFRYSVIYAVLWAIGTSWSTAIRSISLELFPHDTMDVVFAELAAALATTIIGLTIAYVTTRPYSVCCEWMCSVKRAEEEAKPPSKHFPPAHSVMRSQVRG